MRFQSDGVRPWASVSSMIFGAAVRSNDMISVLAAFCTHAWSGYVPWWSAVLHPAGYATINCDINASSSLRRSSAVLELVFWWTCPPHRLKFWQAAWMGNRRYEYSLLRWLLLHWVCGLNTDGKGICLFFAMPLWSYEEVAESLRRARQTQIFASLGCLAKRRIAEPYSCCKIKRNKRVGLA